MYGSDVTKDNSMDQEIQNRILKVNNIYSPTYCVMSYLLQVCNTFEQTGSRLSRENQYGYIAVILPIILYGYGVWKTQNTKLREFGSKVLNKGQKWRINCSVNGILNH